MADVISGGSAPSGGWAQMPVTTRLKAFVRRHKLAPYLMLAPALAGIALVLLWPLIQVAIYSFQNYTLQQVTGALPTQWVGFANFTTTFQDPEFWLSLRNSVLFAVVAVPLTLFVGTIVGLMLNRLGKKMAIFVSTAALLAWATPPVSASILFYWMFNPDGGLVDWTLARMPHWLVGSTNWAQYIWASTGALPGYTMIALLVIWQAFPFIAVTLLAGLKTIPAELTEAARVDGASRLTVLWRVVLPLSGPALATLAALTFLDSWNNFLWPLIVITSTPQMTLPLGLAMFQSAHSTEWTLLMAGNVMSLTPMMIIFFVAQRYFIRSVAATGLAGTLG